jgi:hypothetical protein
MREKLIEILRVPIFPHELADPTEVVADYLLDNDVVPVVRCKDCKFSSEDGGYDSIEQMKTHLNCRRIHIGFIGCAIVPKEGFCSYGERKDNG